MDRECYDRLDSTASSPSELFEHFERWMADGRTYHVLPDARHGVEQRTVIVEDTDGLSRTDDDAGGDHPTSWESVRTSRTDSRYP